MTKKSTPPAVLPHGISNTDLALLERLAGDLSGLARAIRKGDTDAAQRLYPALRRLPNETRKIPLIALRATRARSP